MKTQPLFATTLVAVCAGLACNVALAGLKERPPKGVALTGTWQLDPYRSDDPKAVLATARDQARESGDGPRTGGRHRGGMGGGGFPGGGGYPGGGGGGFPGGGSGGPGGGGWGHHGGRGGQRSGGGEEGGATQGAHRGDLLSGLAANPAQLAFSTTDNVLRIAADDSSTECAAGVKVAISDSAGSAERNCGWDGRAWVIETTRGKDFKRTDRYEIAKDGSTLTFVTTASGGRLPKIKITRTYTVGAPPAPASAPASALAAPPAPASAPAVPPAPASAPAAPPAPASGPAAPPAATSAHAASSAPAAMRAAAPVTESASSSAGASVPAAPPAPAPSSP